MTEHDEPVSDDPDQQPLSSAESSIQIIGLLAEQLGGTPSRVLELGCGVGRVLAPLAEAGHDVTGIDRDASALAECRRRLSEHDAQLIEGDFVASWPIGEGQFDAVCCLGNTFMTIWDVDRAVDVLRNAAETLGHDGIFVMDDLPGMLWPELTGGNWQGGTNEDGSMQLVWAEDDAVFELRRDDEVDESDWTIGAPERRLRLWTLGALRLAGRLAGLSAIERRAGSSLLILRRGGG